MNNELVQVAFLGKSVGLKGYIKLYNTSDFFNQFKKNSKFFDKDGLQLILKDFNHLNNTALFLGFENVELAKTLTNKILYSTKELTRKTFKLKKDEFFYFDIIGITMIEYDEILGIVTDIEDSTRDYILEIKTDDNLVNKGFAKCFYLPYVDNFVINVNLKQGKIFVKNSKLILENS